MSYAYTTVSNVPRLASITDPVSGRMITPFYQGDPACTAPDGGWGFDAEPPAGMLCGVGFWDASSARLWYVNGRLGRVETNIDSTAPPGSQATVKTDYAYDANGRLVQIRDPLAADAVMAGVRSDTETVTAVTYDTSGRVASVELPAPTVGASRPKHTYEYHVDNPGVCPEAGNDCTLMHTVGLTEPLGWTQRVDHDSSYRTIRVTDATGVATTQVWDGPDRLLSSTDGAGRMTTTIYDDRNQPVDTYGPAPGCWFGTDRRPLPDGTTPPGGCTPLPAANAFTSATPRTHTGYDEAIVSLAGTWYANKNLTGSPVLHSTGVGETSGAIWKTWAGSPPAGVPAGEWGLRLTGDIDLAVAGSYQVRVFSDDGARVWIDDKVVLDDWTAGAQRWHPDSTPVTLTAGKHRLRLDYQNVSGADARLELHWGSNAAGYSGAVAGSLLAPRYGLATTQTVYDNGGVAGGVEVTATGYTDTTQGIGPEHGLAVTQTLNPGADGLVTYTKYEAPSPTTYLRRIAKTLPLGNTTTYSHWGDTETATHPCNGGSAVSQAGLLRQTTGPDPTGSQTAQVWEYRYDSAGRTVGVRRNNETGWSCTTHDNRGRPTSQTWPAFGSETATVPPRPTTVLRPSPPATTKPTVSPPAATPRSRPRPTTPAGTPRR